MVKAAYDEYSKKNKVLEKMPGDPIALQFLAFKLCMYLCMYVPVYVCTCVCKYVSMSQYDSKD